MSATRLLVLGVVRGYGRAHGYRIGNDLLTWGADDWANVKWGSIYHALKALTKDGYLRAFDSEESPGRTDYELTREGETEFMQLLGDALRRPELRPDMLGAGLALLPALPREKAIALLTERLEKLEAERDRFALARRWQQPEHVRELYDLWAHTADSGAEWTKGLIKRLSEGAYPLAGEPDSPGMPGSWPGLRQD